MQFNLGKVKYFEQFTKLDKSQRTTNQVDTHTTEITDFLFNPEGILISAFYLLEKEYS